MKNVLLITGMLAVALFVNGCGSDNKEVVEKSAALTETEAVIESADEATDESVAEVDVAVKEAETAVVEDAAEETEAVAVTPDVEAAAAEAVLEALSEAEEAEETVETVEAVEAVDPDAVVVTVNGQKITEKEVAEQLDEIIATQKMRMPPGIEIPDAIKQQMRKSAVDKKIEDVLLDADLKAKGIEISDEQIQEELEKIAGEQGLSMEQVEEELAKSKMTLEDLKRRLRNKMQIETLMESQNPGSAVTEAEAKKFYDDNPQHFIAQENQLRASHILCGKRGIKEEEYPAELEKIKAAQARLDAGEAFEDVARECSSCPSNAKGGDLGFFNKGDMDPAFEKAALELEVGQTSGIVKSSFGYHIIKRTGNIEFEEVKENITQYLTQQKQMQFWAEYRKTLRDDAAIEYSAKEQAFLDALQKAAAERAAARQSQAVRPMPAPAPEPEKAEAVAEEK